jgi:glycosyltransferase involved in cell wall biosynthesis
VLRAASGDYRRRERIVACHNDLVPARQQFRDHADDRSLDSLDVLRVSHSGVVNAWRERDRALRALGVRETLATARRWNEGGSVVAFDPSGSDADSTVGVATFGRHPYRFVFEPVALWRALRATPYDVLDIHEEPASLAAAEVQLLAWVAGRRVPFCLYSAQNIDKRYPVPFRWLERIALRRAAAVHTCNDGAGMVLRHKGFRGVVRNLGLGVDVDRFAPSVCARAPRRTMRVGYVGRLEAHKGVHVLIDAVARLPECELMIVGDGPERVALLRRVEALELVDRVEWAGFVSHDDLPEWFHRFDVVAVPSLDTPRWVEQFGRVAVEAMACGLPVVASASGSLPEVVGAAGTLVRPGDANALADALRELAVDPAERARLGALGRARSLRYAWSAIAQAQLELYEEVAARAR